MTTASAPVIVNRVKQKLAAGDIVLSMLVQQARSGHIALAAEACVYDALTVDLEHSPLSTETACDILLACLMAGITPLVRVAGANSLELGRLLDAGALGVILTHCETAEDAESLVRACRFPPAGVRSVAPNWPQLGYRRMAAPAARAALDASMAIIAMIETPAGVHQAEAIAAVDGVDVLQLGCNDFCDSIGVPGALRDPRVTDAMTRIVNACRKHGKAAGVGGTRTDVALTQSFIRAGVRYVAAGNEWSFMLGAIHAGAAELRAVNVN
jgi:2-keto-3-deoxy-L-rhamnonate aldolase RhmA